MKLKLRRREIILIGGFWLIGCSLLAIVIYFGIFQNQPGTRSSRDIFVPQATFTVVHNQITARSIQDRAFEQARSLWQEDAQLMAVISTWEKTALNEVGQPSAWTYRFYSPSARRMLFVTINPNGEIISTLHTERIQNSPNAIPADGWSMDSSEAINAWLNYGGATMLSAMPGIQVVAQLQVKSQDSAPTWTVAGYDKASQNYHSIFIDAKSKEVLQIESSLQ